MNKEKQIYNKEEYIRIDKKQARNMYFQENDYSILILPTNVRFDNMWVYPYDIKSINKNFRQDFDTLINQYESLNCQNELGNKCKFYAKIKDIELYKSEFSIVDLNKGQLPSTINEAFSYTRFKKKDVREYISKNDIITIKKDCYCFGICFSKHFQRIQAFENVLNSQIV